MLLSAQHFEGKPINQPNNNANIVPIQIFVLDCKELVNLEIGNIINHPPIFYKKKVSKRKRLNRAEWKRSIGEV